MMILFEDIGRLLKPNVLKQCGTSKSSQWDDIFIDGNPEELKYVAYFGKGDEIVAISSMARDPVSRSSSADQQICRAQVCTVTS